MALNLSKQPKNDFLNALAELRNRIKKTEQKYRHPNDTSKSMFNPEQGFAYAYSAEEVDALLDEFRSEMANALIKFHTNSDDALLSMAKDVAKITEDPTMLNFVEKVEQYVRKHKTS